MSITPMLALGSGTNMPLSNPRQQPLQVVHPLSFTECHIHEDGQRQALDRLHVLSVVAMAATETATVTVTTSP